MYSVSFCIYVLTALRDKRSSVVTQLKQLQSETEPIIKIFEDQTVVEQIESTRDGRDLFQFLEKEHNVSHGMPFTQSLMRLCNFGDVRSHLFLCMACTHWV